MPRKQFYDYEGKLAIVRYEPRRCIHAEECVKGLPGVFERDRRPWIDPDQGMPRDLVDVVANGPVFLEGRLRIEVPEGVPRSEVRMALCRCGDSRDNSHQEAGFSDAGTLGAAMMAP